MLKLTAATALIQHSLRLQHSVGKIVTISLTPQNSLEGKNWNMITILSAMWGKFSPHAWIEVELGQKGGKGKQQLAATVITTFAPISLISPTLLEHRGGNCTTENKSALCGSPSPAALTPARHNWGKSRILFAKIFAPPNNYISP